ncbi:MAG: efflux RND transporter permease subunit [bacterium]|nr:efflux RND transporter permease subunit [bacterium]
MQNLNVKKKIKETFRITTTRPVAILMVVLAVFVFGLISYQRLSLNLMPDITYPSLTVRTEYPGTAPEEIETIISRPVEQSLGIVNNLVNISSISKAGFSDVILEFTWDTDMNLATQDVREKLDQVFLPPDVKRPMILRYDPTLDPIIRLGLYGNSDLFALRRISDEEIRRELETVPGVAAVKIKGGLEEEIRVEISERQLAILNIGIDEINQRLFQENINLAGGNLKEGDTEYLVRTLNEFKTLEEISSLIIGTRNNADIRIRDIGRVFRTNKEREVSTRVNGVESVDIEIFKEADANIVRVAAMIRNAIFGTPEQQAFVSGMYENQNTDADIATRREMTNYIAYSLPEGIEIVLHNDQSEFIKKSLDEVRNTALMGGILAIVILYFFLRNITSTVIIGLTIPVSIIATFAPMYIYEVSLNIMSLGGLALGIGMLVDNSIVVLESIFRCREEGDSIIEAAVRGTGEVGSAVIASTLTTIAVFFPIVFVEGVAGQIFGDMSLVVVFSLLASLLAALFFIPMLASRQITSGDSKLMLDRVSNIDIFKFPAFNDMKTRLNVIKENPTLNSTASLYGFAVINIFRNIYDLALKLFQVLTTLVFIVLEFVITILKSIMAFFIAPFSKSDLSEEQNSSLLPDIFGSRIWNGLLIFKPYHSLRILLNSYYTWLKDKKIFTKILFGLLTIIFANIYALFRFILEIFFSLLGKAIILFTVVVSTVFFALLLSAGFIVLLFILPAVGLFNLFFKFINSVYPNVIRGAIKFRSGVILGATAFFALVVIYLLPNIGQELIPELHQGEYTVEFTYPVGTPLEKTAEYLQTVEASINDISEIRKVNSIIGVEKNSATSTSEEGEHTARLNVVLTEGGSIIAKEERTMREIREKLANLSGVTTKISRPSIFSFKTPIEVEIRGFSLERLRALSDDVVARMSNIQGLTDIKSNIRRGNPEIQIRYDRTKLAKNNLNIYQVASLIRNKVQGAVATEFKDRERRIDILVRVREEDKANLEDLYRLVINPGDPRPIPLSSVATISINEGPSEIRRINQQRVALITANIDGVDLGTVTERIGETLQSLSIPPDFSTSVTGQNKEMETSLDSLRFALLLAIFLIYVVMASQFESLIHPFVILFTIPLAIIGVIVTLYVLDISLSVVVFIGLIMLAGIVVNNAIVLVDYINQLRERGMEKVEAIVLAGKVRLRPILMTTATTVLGLLPMALGLGEGAEIRTPMAITVIAGLISSTVLTLIVIPTVYSIVDRRK